MQNTAILMKYQVELYLYKDGGADNCPRATLSDKYLFN